MPLFRPVHRFRATAMFTTPLAAALQRARVGLQVLCARVYVSVLSCKIHDS